MAEAGRLATSAECGVASYRIHCFDGDIPDETFVAADDGEALALVRLRLVRVDCELWCGSRLVATLPKKGGAPLLLA
jgi:hypothetical protein